MPSLPTTISIEGFTVADVILVVGGKIYSECMEKIVILMLDNLRKFGILTH